MAERKVLNKYFHPDFDPSKLEPPAKTGAQHKVRLMAPFSMRCATCGEFIYKGTKFNARKEIVWEEEYLGIKVYRFYIRCPRCAAELTFKTDPKNADYIAEHGMTRNFEAWREEKDANERLTFRQEMEQKLNPILKVEQAMVDSKLTIDILEHLDEVQMRNAEVEKIGVEAALQVISEQRNRKGEERLLREKEQLEEDARIAKEVFERKQKKRELEISATSSATNDETRGKVAKVAPSSTVASSALKMGIVKKKQQQPVKAKSLVAGYGSDSDD
eukprot:Partr_v1_DN26337_c1_g1_i1_m43325 putative Coiled-coil domain-containing protein